MLWFALSKVNALNPIYAQIARVWYKLRAYIRVFIICVVVFLMVKNKVCRMVVSGFYSFRGITYFCQHRIRIKVSGGLSHDTDSKILLESSPTRKETTPSTPFIQLHAEPSVSSVNKRLFIEDTTNSINAGSGISNFESALLKLPPVNNNSSLVLYGDNHSQTQGKLIHRHNFQSKYSSIKSTEVYRPIPPSASPFRHPHPLQSSDHMMHCNMDRGQLQYTNQQRDSESYISSVRIYIHIFELVLAYFAVLRQSPGTAHDKQREEEVSRRARHREKAVTHQ